jgi:hypothetical protein
MEGKRFCLLCMGAALRGAASSREPRGKALPHGLADVLASYAFPRGSRKDAGEGHPCRGGKSACPFEVFESLWFIFSFTHFLLATSTV